MTLRWLTKLPLITVLLFAAPAAVFSWKTHRFNQHVLDQPPETAWLEDGIRFSLNRQQFPIPVGPFRADWEFFDNVLKRLSETTGLRFEPHWEHLRSRGVRPDSICGFVFEGGTLQELMPVMIRGVNRDYRSFTYVLRDDVVVVSTYEELAEHRVYAVDKTVMDEVVHAANAMSRNAVFFSGQPGPPVSSSDHGESYLVWLVDPFARFPRTAFPDGSPVSARWADGKLYLTAPPDELAKIRSFLVDFRRIALTKSATRPIANTSKGKS